MSYSEFKTVGAVLQEYQVYYAEANFVAPLAFSISEYFREDLHLMMREGVVDNSDAICENLIYPVLARQSPLGKVVFDNYLFPHRYS